MMQDANIQMTETKAAPKAVKQNKQNKFFFHDERTLDSTGKQETKKVIEKQEKWVHDKFKQDQDQKPEKFVTSKKYKPKIKFTVKDETPKKEKVIAPEVIQTVSRPAELLKKSSSLGIFC